MSADERLRKIRGGHRAVTTKIVRDVDEILASGTLEPEQLNRLGVKLQQLDGKLKVLSDIDKEILDKCDVDAIEREIDDSEAISAKILHCKQRISEAIKGVVAAPSATGIVGTATSGTCNKPKLPKLTLPRFRGDLNCLDHILGFV